MHKIRQLVTKKLHTMKVQNMGALYPCWNAEFLPSKLQNGRPQKELFKIVHQYRVYIGYWRVILISIILLYACGSRYQTWIYFLGLDFLYSHSTLACQSTYSKKGDAQLLYRKKRVVSHLKYLCVNLCSITTWFYDKLTNIKS